MIDKPQRAGRMPLVIIIAIAVLTPLASTIMFYLWQPAAATHKGEVIAATTPPAIFPPPSWQNTKAKNGEREKSGSNAKGKKGGDDWRGEWRGKWVLLQTTPTAQCNEQCRRRLCQMRQLRLMLPGHYLRINRAWLINKTGGGNATTDDDDNTKTIGGDNAKGGGDDIGESPVMSTNDCGEIKSQSAAAKRAQEVDITNGIFILQGDNKTLPPPTGNWQRNDYIYLIDPAGRMAMRFSPTLTIYDIRKDLSRLLKLSRGWRQTQ